MPSINILHNNSSITNLSDFGIEHQIVFSSDFTVNDLLNYDGNKERIQQSYLLSPNSEEEANVNRLESPTFIKVPVERINKEIILTESQNLVIPNKNFELFWGEEITSLISSQKFRLNNNRAKSKYGNYKQKVSYNVFVFCKALGDLNSAGKLINITPFVDLLTTNVGENGGNFSIKLSPAMCEFDEKEGWVYSRLFNTKNDERVLQKSSVHDVDEKRRLCFFSNVIQSNDLVFIQFDKTENADLFLSNDILPSGDYDMIGLIDSVPNSYDSLSADISVDLQGRDLMKLFIEDGAYFFPLDFANNDNGFINGDTRSFKRLVDGQLEFFNAYLDRTVESCLKFIVNQLSNIKIVDNDLFKHYEERVKTYQISDKDYVEQDVEGIWQIIRLIFDSEIDSRRIVDSSVTTDSGSLLNFINKVCQQPFVEFFGDTYGDKYHLIIRKPPHTGYSIQNYIKSGLVIDIFEDDVINDNLSFDDSEVFSWYRLIPKGNFFGDSSDISLVEFPAIFLKEYADIWGSRPLQIVSNYINYTGNTSSNKKVNLEYLKMQSLQDLAFIVESNAYLPFTRKGSITINGDRRIRRGSFVRLVGTGEIFHVDQVSQSAVNGETVDRQTNVIVSRGMVEKNIFDVTNNYFNIVNLNKDEKGQSQSVNFSVNSDVFKFFLKRRQFVKTNQLA